MTSLNEVKLIGRIGKDPEMAKTNDGRLILKFSLATSDRWTDKLTNEKKEKTEWHKIVIYNPQQWICEMLEQNKEFLTGAMVCVSGKLRYEKWLNPKTNIEQKSSSIVVDSFSGQFLILSKNNKNASDSSKKSESSSNETNFNDLILSSDEESDEIPF